MDDYDYTTQNLQNLRLSDNDTSPPPRTPTSRPQAGRSLSALVDKDARDAALKAELAGVRQINTVIEGVIGSLKRAKSNMEVRIPPPQQYLRVSRQCSS